MEIARRETEELFCFLLLDDWVEADGKYGINLAPLGITSFPPFAASVSY